MRLFQSILAVTAIVVAAAAPCSAQTPSADAPARQVHFDASAIGLNVGFAVRNSPRTSFGASLGIGGNWWNYMVLGGRHFSESGGLSYQSKDGATGKDLLELGRATVFMRRHFDGGRQIDVGLKSSVFLHGTSADDDPGFGGFAGLNVTGVWWKWRRLGLGSQLDVGGYTDGRPEFGVNVAPVLVRLTFP